MSRNRKINKSPLDFNRPAAVSGVASKIVQQMPEKCRVIKWVQFNWAIKLLLPA